MKKTILSLLSIFSSSLLFAQPYNNNGDVFFNAPIIHEIKLSFSQVNYWDSLVDSYVNDYYILGNVEIDGTLKPYCGIKFKGNSSYNNPSQKKSMKIDFNEFVPGQDYNDLKKLNLNNCFKDPTFLREKLMLDFLNYKGISAPRCTYANVYLNNVYWGLYTVVEEIDNTFLKNRFNDKKGNLFKGDPSGDLKYLGATASSYYTKYELKNNETQNDWSDLIQLTNKLNNTPIAVLPDTLEKYFDLDNYYYQWAAHILFSNLDSYAGSGHNYYIYHDSLINKFRFITWDVNEAFGNFNQGMTVTQIENLSIYYTPNPPGNRPLHERLLQNATAKQKLADAVCDLINMDFSIWNLEAKIDSLVNILRPHVYSDPNKFFTNQNFEDNINSTITVMGTPGGNNLPGIKSFLINRRSAAGSQVALDGCVVGITDALMAQNEIIIYPQPAQNFIVVSNLNPNENWSYRILNSLGQEIKSGSTSNNGQIALESITESGIYYLQIRNQRETTKINRKFIKI